MIDNYEYALGSLRAHFLENTGRIMSSNELREVAGISNWRSLIRELREKDGYPILTNRNKSILKPGEYLLETSKPHPLFEQNIPKSDSGFSFKQQRFCLLYVRCRWG